VIHAHRGAAGAIGERVMEAHLTRALERIHAGSTASGAGSVVPLGHRGGPATAHPRHRCRDATGPRGVQLVVRAVGQPVQVCDLGGRGCRPIGLAAKAPAPMTLSQGGMLDLTIGQDGAVTLNYSPCTGITGSRSLIIEGGLLQGKQQTRLRDRAPDELSPEIPCTPRPDERNLG